jgi:hypothetical protein
MLAVHNASTTEYSRFNREVYDHFLASSLKCIFFWMGRNLISKEVQLFSSFHVRTKDMELLRRAPRRREQA